MGWDCYPFKDGKPVNGCPVGMHAGRYEKALEELTGLSVRFQGDDRDQPDWDSSVVQSIYGASLDDANTDDRRHVQDFLRWCVENRCGIIFSF